LNVMCSYSFFEFSTMLGRPYHTNQIGVFFLSEFLWHTSCGDPPPLNLLQATALNRGSVGIRFYSARWLLVILCFRLFPGFFPVGSFRRIFPFRFLLTLLMVCACFVRGFDATCTRMVSFGSFRLCFHVTANCGSSPLRFLCPFLSFLLLIWDLPP